MKKHLTYLIMIGAAGLLPLTSTAKTLSVSEDLNLDFTKEMESIEKINHTATPMHKHLKEGLSELSVLIGAVKENPNQLNKAKFELQFAKSIQTLIQDMDDILENRQEIDWALTDISSKVKTVTKRLDFNNGKTAEEISRVQERLAKEKEMLKKLGREIKRKGDKADPEKKREFSRLYRKYQHGLRAVETHKKIKKMLHRTLVALANNGGRFTQSTRDMDDWFENLKDQRNSFLRLAEARSDIQTLNELLTQGGANSVRNTFVKLRGITSQLAQFSQAFDAMDSDLDALNSFDAQMIDPNDPDDHGLAADPLLDRQIADILGE